MPIVNSRQSLKEYCFRKLGSPVVQINVDDDQVEDRIDDALGMFKEYHSDSIVRNFKGYQLTQNDITRKKIPMPESVLSVIKVFPVTNTGQASNLNLSFTAAMSDILDGLRTAQGGGGIFRYFLVEQHLSLIQQFFARESGLRFNKYQGFIELDTDWSKFNVGDYILVEVWDAVDMDMYDRIWSDWWLESYTTALIKQQWGMNMIKYDGVQLPSGITLNGRAIFDDATREIADLEEKLQNTWQLPIDFFLG